MHLALCLLMWWLNYIMGHTQLCYYTVLWKYYVIICLIPYQYLSFVWWLTWQGNKKSIHKDSTRQRQGGWLLKQCPFLSISNISGHASFNRNFSAEISSCSFLLMVRILMVHNVITMGPGSRQFVQFTEGR